MKSSHAQPGALRPAAQQGTHTIVRQRNRFVLLMLAPATILLLGLTIVPFVISVLLSFTNYALTSPDDLRMRWLGNYGTLLLSADFWGALRTTVVFTALAVGLQLTLGLLIATLLFAETRGVALLRTIYLVPMAIAPVAATFTFRQLFHPSLGAFNYFLEQLGLPRLAWLADPLLALPSLVLVDTWQWTPLVILILYGGLSSLPHEPFEAARVDGATAWQTFRLLTLPMLRPFLAVAALLRGLDAFKTFDIIYVLTGGGPGTSTRTLNLLVYKQGIEFLEMGYAASIAVVMLIIATVVARLFVRRTGLLAQGD